MSMVWPKVERGQLLLIPQVPPLPILASSCESKKETANDLSFNPGVGPADLSLVAANQFNSLSLVFCSRIVKFSLEWYKWMMEAKRRNLLWDLLVDSC